MKRQRCLCTECKPLFQKQDTPGWFGKLVIIFFISGLPVIVFVAYLTSVVIRKLNGG